MYRTLAFLVLTIDGVFGFIVPSALFNKSINDPLFIHRAKSRRIPRFLQATTMSTSNSTPEETSKHIKTVEVMVVGSCNTDLVTYTPRLPSQGECSNVAKCFFPGTTRSHVIVLVRNHENRWEPFWVHWIPRGRSPIGRHHHQDDNFFVMLCTEGISLSTFELMH